ncbi:hypothetical protein Daci_4079 [Delftia acidovorans SPH-1]|uniref:Concanavalin A-like lectin/glucanases superfamily protein n=1 Tax=Delftia acidovorans (strain DSM 14801 / SPH-1) TaxID=398578 RepID=A9BYF3_DELAS|nr:hypothetical protein [Delftia acidovorans]ABX34292.1 hypothetical protein Daci_1649 [Delftia acidovorans SPH-1]ABX36710.1 hypothetical protein Daci_4079 [Delftia acidovorans SPH-1]QPS74040.1 hypothetical protein I6G48_25925 [Delftia acidovorans]QPS76329.1 hypothetical protein I6G48_07195 [Delftia acidovorans]
MSGIIGHQGILLKQQMAGTEVLRMHLDTSTGFSDSTGINVPVAVGDVAISTDEKTTGDASAFFSGGSGAIRVPCTDPNALINPYDKDFSISCDVFVQGFQDGGSTGYIISHGGGLNYSWPNISLSYLSTGQLLFALRSSQTSGAPDISYFVPIGSMNMNEWVEVLISRRSDKFRVRTNGVLLYEVTSNLPVQRTANNAGLGFGAGTYSNEGNVPKEGIKGYIDNIRMVVGGSPGF